MQFHPYVASAGSAFDRLTRACFWQVADMDASHAPYWREQVDMAIADMEAQPVAEGVPERVKLARLQLRRELVGRAILVGYEQGTRRSVRSTVAIPDFGSGSVCNTRTLCNGLHSCPL